jgi:rhodanese-related sulfurtransferase
VLSKKATELLMKYGYTKVKNVNGGINEFGKLYDPNIVRL